jgi:hypothetical protein
MCGDPRDVDLADIELDEEEHVETAEKNGVHREEVAGQHR